MSGTATTNLPLSNSADDVIGNAAGSTIRVSMARLAALLGTLQGPAYGSVTQLQADTAWPAGAIGSVYGGTAAQIGVYRKSGAPGSGSWSRIGDLPVSSITAAQLSEKAALADLTAEIAYRRAAIRDAGIMPLANVAGRNSISATLTPSMIEGGATLANTSTVELIPAETSDGPVQLSLDGATPVPVRDAAGAELQVGALLAGRSYFLRRRGSTWRIIAGGVSSVEMRAEAQARMEGDQAEAQLRLAGDRAVGVHALSAVGGTATAITAELGFPEVPGKTKVILVPAADNTGPVTLKLGTGPIRSIMSADSTNLAPGDLKQGQSALICLTAGGHWKIVGVLRSQIAAAVAVEATARAASELETAANLARLDEQMADPLRKAQLLPTHRPGDTPWLHGSGIAGGNPYTLPPVTNVAVAAEGAVVRIVGAGVISDRRLHVLEPDRQYGVRFALRRAVNPPDPAGDAVRLAIAWYDRFGSLSGTTALENLSPLTTAMGRQSRFFIVSRLPGDDVVAAPAGAVYGRPFIQTYGAGGKTDVEVIDWEDVTGNEVWSPDVGELQGRVVALESLDVGARLGALEVEAGTSANLRFASEADAAAASVPTSVDTLEIVGVGVLRRSQDGYLQTADGSKWGASGSFRKSQFSATRAPLPSDDETQGYAAGSRWQHEWKEWLRTDAGWVPKDTFATPQMFGAAGNGATPDDAAFVAADAADQALRITPPATRYAFSGPVELIGAVEVDPSTPWAALTDNGKLRWRGGYWPNRDASAPIRRMPGRMFVGDYALDLTGDLSNSQGGFVPNGATGASWASRDSAFVVAQDRGLMAITGIVSNANQDYSAGATECIAVSGFVLNYQPNRPAWALYADIQHEQGATFTTGLEVAAKNKGADIRGTPYGLGGGVTGLWLAGGGDDVYGGAPANPSNAAMVVLKNKHTWNVGILFEAKGLTGTDGTAESTGRATAIAMARNHKVSWYAPDGSGEAFSIFSSIPTGGDAWYLEASPSAMTLRRKSDNGTFVQFRDAGAGTTDRVVLQNGTTNVSVRGEGSSPDVDLSLVPKGGGRVRFGPHTAQADAPITGYIEIKDGNGALRKLAVIA